MAGERENAGSADSPRPVRRPAGVVLGLRAGLILLMLLFVYLAAASLWPLPRGFAPGSPGVLYGHLVLKILLGLLVLALASATVLGIRLRWTTLGAWLTHAGVVVLAAGAAWYAARHVSGVAVAGRDTPAAAFAPVQRFFLDDTAAVYAAPTGKDLAAQTPLTSLPLSRESSGLAIAVESPFDDVAITASRYLPAARVSLVWREDGPVEAGAVEVVIRDGPHDFRRTLCPAYPFTREFDGGVYVLRFAPSVRSLGRETPVGKDVALIAPAGAEAVISVIGSDGTARPVRWAAMGKQVKLKLGGREVGLTVVRFYTQAWLAGVAEEAPTGQAYPAIRLDLIVGDWRGSHWLRFDPYVRASKPADPDVQRLPLPGGRTAFLHFAPQSRPLPRPFRVAKLDYLTYPGSTKPMDYACLLEVVPRPGRRPERVECRLNRPAAAGTLRVYQNTWGPSPEAPEEIVFLVASRPGIRAVWLGCILVCLGLPYAFYVKPWLLRRQRRAAG